MTRPLKHSIPETADWFPTTDMDYCFIRFGAMCQRLQDSVVDEHDMANAARIMKKWIKAFETARESGSRLTP